MTRSPATAPQAFYLRNHSASELHRAALATLPTLSTRPSFPDKATFAKWCHDAHTQHVFYTLAEPENPAARGSGHNRIKFLHGLVADYDGDPAAIQAALPELKFAPGKAPTWVTATFSGKARLLWCFERPVPVFSPDVFARLIQILSRELRLKSILPGLDEVALGNAYTPYELGTHWRQPAGDTRLPHAVVLAALHDASAKAKWHADGPQIPLEAIEAEVQRRWPGRWPGPFTDGARGPRFWDALADNPTGCTLRTLGVQAWTGEARFIPWAELLGAAFVKEYRANRIGGAIDGVYFDGRDYWQRDETGCWRPWTSEAMKRRLGVMFRLSADAPRRGEQSEIAQAMTTIENIHSIDGALPCLFAQETIVASSAHRYLNISRVRLMPASGRPREWADGFPWLARYLDGLFDDKQKAFFLSWLAHFYQHAAAGHPRKGHALFLAGPRSAGKTLLSQRVIAPLMGGFQEATRYILGETTFNESLFHAPIWAVDDAVGSADSRRHTLYSAIVKRLVANPSQEYHPKFKKALTVRFHGRLVVTLNVDEDSITMLPATDNTILDKLVVLLCRAPGIDFAEAEKTLETELPHFADYIAAYRIPETVRRNADETVRFGHDAFFHPDLLQTANDANSSVGMKELLQKWRKYHFRASDAPAWSGTTMDLLEAMREIETLRESVRDVTRGSRITAGRDLAKLIRQGLDWLSVQRKTDGVHYTIQRPGDIATTG